MQYTTDTFHNFYARYQDNMAYLRETRNAAQVLVLQPSYLLLQDPFQEIGSTSLQRTMYTIKCHIHIY
jgi:ABC-type lipopolysaccharide export system ATPase subunit